MLKSISPEKLKKILKNHEKWLNGEGGEIADLSRIDLRCVNFQHVNLQAAILRCANLSGVDLRCANLRCANLQYADLQDADISFADLQDTNLQEVNFQWANLHGVNLSRANLCAALLIDTDLSEGILHKANLLRANLFGANLKKANLDYSCFPLWCGSLSAHFDDRQLKQLAYHIVKAGLQSTNASEETKKELSKLIDFANGFHRAEECGLIERQMVEESKEEFDYVNLE